MKKRLRKKKFKNQEIIYLEYLYKEEKEYNCELTEMLEQCLPFLPTGKLRSDIERVIKAANVWNLYNRNSKISLRMYGKSVYFI